MKNLSRILSLLLVLSLLVVPAGAMAEGDVVTLTLSNPTIAMGDQSHSIDVTFVLSAGLEDTMERGFLTLSALSGQNAALTALGALENGVLTAYVDGMQQYISMPFDVQKSLSQLQEEIEVYLDDGAMDFETFLSEYGQAPDVTVDETALNELLAALEGFHVGEEELSLDDGAFTVTCQVYEGALTTEDVIALAKLADRCLSGYFSEAFMAGFAAGMEDADSSAEEMDWDQLLAALKESDAAFACDFVSFRSEEGFFSFDLQLHVGDDAQTTPLNIYCEVGSYDPAWKYGHFNVSAAVDGEAAEIALYADSYQADGSDVWRVMLDAADNDASFSIQLSNENSGAENTTCLYIGADDGETTELTVAYTMAPDQTAPTDHAGLFEVLLVSPDMGELYASVDTALTVSAMPEEELLTIVDLPALDPTTASEEEMTAFSDELAALLENALLQLSDAPGLTELLQLLA